MRIAKMFGALVAGIGLMMLWQGLALADGGPHGPYTLLGTTVTGATGYMGCQRCHAAHRGQVADLIRASSEYALCLSCHGGGAERTDVLHGVFLSGSGTFGTPNDYGNDAPGSTTYSKQLNGGRFNGLSVHQVADDPENKTMWGFDATTGADTVMTAGFKCSSCHLPHGQSLSNFNTTGTRTGPFVALTLQPNGLDQNYRLLQGVPVYSWEGPTTTGGMKSYTKAAWAYKASNGSNNPGALATNVVGIAKFCGRCHADYVQNNYDPAVVNSGDYPNVEGNPNSPSNTRYEHRIGRRYSGAKFNPGGTGAPYPIPMEGETEFRGFLTVDATDPTAPGAAQIGSLPSGPLYNSNMITNCLSCHFAHGSAATAASTSTVTNATGTHSLLRYNDRAVCQSCHAKNIVGTAPPTPPAATATPVATGTRTATATPVATATPPAATATPVPTPAG